jgi:transposase-like protein
MTMENDIKRWTAKRKAALVMEIIQGKTTISEASRAFDISPSEIEVWVDEAKRGMENAVRAKPLDCVECGQGVMAGPV